MRFTEVKKFSSLCSFNRPCLRQHLRLPRHGHRSLETISGNQVRLCRVLNGRKRGHQVLGRREADQAHHCRNIALPGIWRQRVSFAGLNGLSCVAKKMFLVAAKSFNVQKSWGFDFLEQPKTPKHTFVPTMALQPWRVKVLAWQKTFCCFCLTIGLSTQAYLIWI